MAKKRQVVNPKSHNNSERIRREYSTPESIEALRLKMWEVAKKPKTTTITHIALALNYTFDGFLNLIKLHPELHDDYLRIRAQIGMNAYDGIEDRSLTGVFSKYSITNHFTEIKLERDRIKQQEHAREIEKIKMRQEADKNTLAHLITEVREIDGKRIGVIAVNENITYEGE